MRVFRRRGPVWIAGLVMALVLLACLPAGSQAAAAAPEALGWVGNMSPAGGSSSTITAGAAFTVYVQVWKSGVTDSPGQGAGIACTLYWGQVGSFGGSWSNITSTAMVYNTDIGNNDEYKASIMPGQGLYEFTAYCSDDGGATKTWQGSGNGKLTVNAPSASCSGASVGDNNVFWTGLFHDSFSTSFRSPIGPVTTGQGTVTLKFRTCQNDVGSASIRVWDDRTNTETISALSVDSNATDPNVGPVTIWKIDLPIPSQATILYYVFKATDGTATAFYRDDDPKFYGGGYGQAEGDQQTAYNNSYQLTVYDPAFSVPGWMQRGMVYQIFPDRFRDGDSANNPAAGRFSYNTAGGAIVRSNQSNWNYTVCDPRNTYSPSCDGKYGDNFYGGDLRGVIQKLDDGYFDNLGVSVLYLNPIFRAPSNHKYDTADYMVIDPDFGTLADFQELASKAKARGIKIILDGVFNHTSSDSKYFDRYSRFDAAGNLISPGVGTNDGSGACEAGASAFYSWFYFPDTGNPGKDGNVTVYCNNKPAPPGPLNDPQSYEAWYGYSSLPKLQANSTAVRNLIWNNGLNSVGPYWTQQGADGWRFDVGADVDPGLTNDPANDYWEGFRSAVRNAGVTGKSDTLMLGEEWGDASPWLLGNEWDSAMNYRFRSALLSWLFTGCSGNGCTGGTSFEDNDSNSGSSSGAISYISPSQFNARLRSIAEDYPPMAFKAMMNLEGSHDTNRVRFLLKKSNNDQDWAAVQRMKEWWLFAFTYPGAPTLYYGDEVGLNHDGVWYNNKYEDDPYNRAPFPWPDASGSSYAADATLQAFARQMASIRWSYRALQDGDVQHGLVIDNGQKLYGYARTTGSQTALIALNRDSTAHNVTFAGLNAVPYNLPDGTQLVDALTGDLATVYTVSGGAVTISVNPTWGVVLLEKAKIETPAAVSDLNGSFADPNATLTWTTVASDTAGGRELVTAYQVHRHPTDPNFTPDGTTLRATVSPSDAAFRYGSANRQFSYSEALALAAPAAATPDRPAAVYYYKVCPVNAPGVRGACTPAVGPLAVALASFSAAGQANAIQVTWDTVSEIGNAGFILYRDSSPAGPGVRLNAGLIPSQGPNSPNGFSYSYLDSANLTPNTTYYYWLEDVNMQGYTTRHEPASVLYTGGPTAVGLAHFGAAAGGPGTLPLAAGGLAVLALAGAVVALRRRG